MQFLAKVLSTVALASVSFALQAQTLIEKADKQYEMHAYRLAAKSYETLLARDPNDVNTITRLADAYFHLNQLDDATRWYAKAVKENNVQPNAILNYGKALMMLGLYNEAETQFNNYKKHDASIASQFLKSCRFARENDTKEGDTKITPLSKCNTLTSEFGISTFNNQLVWSSNRTDMKRSQENGIKNDWTGSAKNQLFVSDIDNNNTKVSFLKSDFKNVYNESNPTFSSDGKTVFFMRNNFDDGERISSAGGMDFSIFMATVNEQGAWVDVRAFPYNGTGFSTGFPSLSPDGKSLYFVSNRPGGQGGFDIYVSNKRGSIWGEPRNLGATINTAGDEIAPFSDGSTLYFASDYQIGYGGFDIFKSEGLGAESINMGLGINSSGDDFGYFIDATTKNAYFISNRKGGKGKEDIYQIQRLIEAVNLIALDNNGKPLKDVKLTVVQGNNKNIAALKSGNWLVDLHEGKTQIVELKKDGFKAKTVKIEPQYVKVTHTQEITMERDVPTEMSTTPQYKGIIKDASTDETLEGVLVKATNQTTNAQLEAVTDIKGRYAFNLSPNATYLITYSKEGYVISKKTFKTNVNDGKSLGDIILKPSAVSNKTELVVSTTGGKKTTPSPVKVPPAYNNRPEEVTVKGATVAAYSVQLLVSSNDDAISLSKFDNLKALGNIYIIPESGKQKVRIGVFATKEAANAALEKVKASGNSSAYIVEEKNAKAVEANKFTPQPKAKTEDKATTTPQKTDVPKPYVNVVKPKDKKAPTTEPTKKTEEPKKETPAKTPIIDKTYKVKIAAMKKPEWFDDSKVAAFWKIDQVKEGDLTIFIMDGIKTLQQAKDLKSKVQAAGYKDAKVVLKENDKFKIVD